MVRDRLSLFFVVILLLAFSSFMYWGLDHTNHLHITLFTLATVFGLFMAFNMGGNDVADSFGTSVGAGTLTIRQAVAAAAILEAFGAMIAAGAVTNTIRSRSPGLSRCRHRPSWRCCPSCCCGQYSEPRPQEPDVSRSLSGSII